MTRILRINVGQQIKYRRQTHVILEIDIKEDNTLTIYTEERKQYLEKMRVDGNER